ncbi:Translationally-controlled tumor protein [Sciurus carolinensis]|uniref:Translationally-controlled tumor protein n=1 Tax=Sciurus carolinensis TaxID=30640 RepID=A0AA41SZC0_SCICA|nr:Translationally-controlled tumor protein [Sciurus carolinensis]
MVSRAEDNIDNSIIDGNEGPEGKGTKSTLIAGVHIVMKDPLQETCFTKEACKYIKRSHESINGKLAV